MNRKFHFLLILVIFQSCFVPVRRDYLGFSPALAFNNEKKWLINDLFSDLTSVQREHLDRKILAEFNYLSGGKAFSVAEAKSKNLLPSNISYTPNETELENLRTNTDFDFLVNVRTVQLRDEVSTFELNKPLQYSKNSAFALLEVYDLKTGKKIYYQKAFSEMDLDRQQNYPEISTENANRNLQENRNKGPFFTYSASSLSIKNLKKILKDIDKKAVK
ncbi:hypothetical protein [Frigoriflavimonas asaccharolytica]|uniref:Lipoprotein n=1 Tax=Frigoriflavimonas asaccharolytica TaxID=2735899 RepID=A0A8J8G941_9FLAO|nr:hypothetical protein [Frigoriflavimonas asaccharolytica]NRS91754.1 hypothetical protein [Frigoriflavimonas asaccharolytica]